MSEATPEETTTPAPEAEAAQEPTSAPPWGDDFDAAKAWKLVENLRADKERLSARKVLSPEDEQRLVEYRRLEEASRTDLERAQETAAAASERVSALQGRLAAAEIKAALTGVVPDVEAFLEDINIARFIGDDGEVNTEAVQALRTKYAAFAPAPEKPGMRPNPSQGSSASPAPSVQDQIAQAQAAGDFKTAIRLKASQALHSPDN